MTHTLIIADDHPIVRKGLSEMILQSGEWQILAEADCGQTALACFQQHKPDVMMLDISMGTFGGLEVAERIFSEHKQAKFVIMTMYNNPVFYQQAKAIGVQGYLLKDDTTETILACLNTVQAGKTYVTDSLIRTAEDNMETFIDPKTVLTDKELAVFYEIAALKNNKQIAESLGVTVKTVQNHRHNIGEKLGLKGKQALLTYAGKWRTI